MTTHTPPSPPKESCIRPGGSDDQCTSNPCDLADYCSSQGNPGNFCVQSRTDCNAHTCVCTAPDFYPSPRQDACLLDHSGGGCRYCSRNNFRPSLTLHSSHLSNLYPRTPPTKRTPPCFSQEPLQIWRPLLCDGQPWQRVCTTLWDVVPQPILLYPIHVPLPTLGFPRIAL